ncbi:MAG: hypothetical protein LBP36_04325 [Oscillospiraceae bacterium]|nr:hypothetical protein [Oscillospiraceae bacterium]
MLLLVVVTKEMIQEYVEKQFEHGQKNLNIESYRNGLSWNSRLSVATKNLSLEKKFFKNLKSRMGIKL